MRSIQSARLVLLFFGLTLSSIGSAQAKYRRVLVVGEDPTASHEQKLAIADGFASAIERAVNLNIARSVYGRRVGSEAQKTTPLAFLLRSIQDVNMALNETFMSNRTYEKYLIAQIESRASSDPWVLGFDIHKVPLFSRLSSNFEGAIDGLMAGQTRTLTYEILTIPGAVELPEPDPSSAAGIAKDSGIQLASVMLQAARVGDAQEYDKILDLYDHVDGFTSIDQATAQSKNLYKLARDAYIESLSDESRAWNPMYVSVSLTYGQSGFEPSIRVILRPGPGMGGPVGLRGAEFDAQPPSKKIVDVRTMDYTPHFSYRTGEPAAMAISARSSFGNAEQKRPLAKITWGRMPIESDIRVITQCTSQCDQDLASGSIGRHYPTINGVFRFEFIEVIPPNNENRGFFGRVKEGIKRRVNQLVANASSFVANVSEKGHFHLMIQTLGIELGMNEVRVVPSESAFTMGIGDGAKAITINPVSNSVAGVDLNLIGFDMYSKIAPEISSAFSTEINAKFEKAKLTNAKDFSDKQVKFMEALAPIVKVLNEY